ncbi:MAG: aminopeptidase [Proteobacteria bacterium]|nr:aminopeptidase [Pseudomonadota bacterium]
MWHSATAKGQSHYIMMHLLLRSGVIVLALVITSGCAKLGYYTQAIGGQLEILAKRRSIPALLDDPDTAPELGARLAPILEMRTFASEELGLPDNKSYRTYVDLKRRYAVWNVFAAPELSLDPVNWCFVFVGCVSYRGYFSERGAQKFANKLAQDNYDVYVAGIAAYSTLGWFHDPMLNTILRRTEPEIAGLIFHELTHQVVYVRGHTEFNESFALTVELEGIKRWLAAKGSTDQFQKYLVSKKRRDEFVQLVMKLRRQLGEIYAAETSDDEKRAAKQEAFIRIRRNYEELKKDWGGYTGHDAWFARDLNNAHLVSVGLYNQYVPAFQALLSQHNGDFKAFYGVVQELSQLSKAKRAEKLRSLQVTTSQ